MIRNLLIVAAAFVAVSVRADDGKPKGPRAADVLAEGLSAAKKDGKAVFLAFGSPSCHWCTYLDKFHARPSVAKILGKHLVFVKVDIVENEGGDKLYDTYAPQPGGVPIWVILGADGKVLADSFEVVKGKKQNVGFPYQPNEIVHYEKAIRAALPKLNEAEVEEVLTELKNAGPKKVDKK